MLRPIGVSELSQMLDRLVSRQLLLNQNCPFDTEAVDESDRERPWVELGGDGRRDNVRFAERRDLQLEGKHAAHGIGRGVGRPVIWVLPVNRRTPAGALLPR